MTTLTKRLALAGLAIFAGALAFVGAASAEDAAFADAAETAYIFNTFSFLFNGALVMWMAAGFCMLEAGLVRSKSVATICTKNIALYSIAGIMYFLVGYNLMYDGVDGGFMGSFSWANLDGPAYAADEGYAPASDWFFQMVFVATAASIVSGTLAERIKLWPFLVFVVALTAVIYPIQGAWQWGGGWLAEAGFSDFAGSTLVHSTGGWAALVGAVMLGARRGKYGPGGIVHPLPGSSLPLATLGTFILWLGWFGFNGGSQLALGTGDDAAAMAHIFANTNLAAAAGVVAAMLASQALFKKVDLTMALNGALGGLVSITAEPLAPNFATSVMVGGIGGVLVVLAVPLLDRLRIDDVVGAIPVHLVCGIWGTVAVVFSNPETNIGSQLLGIVAIGAWVVGASTVVWLGLKLTVGIRLDEESEAMGADQSELGLEAYPEFGSGSQRI
jgi:ammonium transporter, Amt family